MVYPLVQTLSAGFEVYPGFGATTISFEELKSHPDEQLDVRCPWNSKFRLESSHFEVFLKVVISKWIFNLSRSTPEPVNESELSIVYMDT